LVVTTRQIESDKSIPRQICMDIKIRRRTPENRYIFRDLIF
jgi:uncharacterized protein YcfJ